MTAVYISDSLLLTGIGTITCGLRAYTKISLPKTLRLDDLPTSDFRPDADPASSNHARLIACQQHSYHLKLEDCRSGQNW